MSGDYRELGPLRATGRNPRARGTNARAQGTNPRRSGTNPSAGTRTDRHRVASLKRRAIARYRVTHGRAWCETCDDTTVELVPGTNTYRPCSDHRTMTANDAGDILGRRSG